MIKLEDLLIMSYSNIIIMKGNFEVLIISNKGHLDMSYLSKNLLDSKIDRIESVNNYIKVWLNENKND